MPFPVIPVSFEMLTFYHDFTLVYSVHVSVHHKRDSSSVALYDISSIFCLLKSFSLSESSVQGQRVWYAVQTGKPLEANL